MKQPLTILVDGYNVIHKLPGLRPEDGVPGHVARERLIERLRARYGGRPDTVVVVFDGDGVTETAHSIRGVRGRAVYSRRGQSADDVIRRLCAEYAGLNVCVCTDDIEVRETTAESATAASTAHLGQRLSQPDRYQAARFRDRFARREYEARKDAGLTRRPAKGNATRAPKRRRGRDGPPL